MAASASHQLGELIGDFFELWIINYMRPFVTQKGYYLDYRHPRPARNLSREVIGIDQNGNKHKLDIVVERDGSETQKGTPKAFIEMAWRRYVKHSKNKVQEIAGAILPLISTYSREMPFYAAVLSGEFTDNALKQLESQGFYVLYFNYAEMAEVFDTIDVSIRWQEDTSEAQLQRIADRLANLSSRERNQLQNNFFSLQSVKLQSLVDELNRALDVVISEIIVTPVHGRSAVLRDIDSAVDYIQRYSEVAPRLPILRYEIIVRYTGGMEYTMKCDDKRQAIRFLQQYR